jgi:hypothetical protein
VGLCVVSGGGAVLWRVIVLLYRVLPHGTHHHGPAGTSSSITSGDRQQAEWTAIQAAADRLLAGTPLRSSGELTVVQLAAEAGVKRWLLTHKHRDLAEQFQARARALGREPPQVGKLKTRLARLEERVAQLKGVNAELRMLVEYYTHVINELTIDCERLTTERNSLLGNVRALPGRPTSR